MSKTQTPLEFGVRVECVREYDIKHALRECQYTVKSDHDGDGITLIVRGSANLKRVLSRLLEDDHTRRILLQNVS